MSSQVDGMPGAEDPGVERPVVEDSERPSGRHRGHRFPARTHRVKVMYADDELAVVREAAHEVGLRLSGYVAAAALAAAEGNAPPGGRGKDRLLLAELIQLRIGLRQYGVNLNQIAARLNSGGTVPVWLPQVIAGGERVVARVDEAAAVLARRLR